MSYATIGFGNIGRALANAYARNSIEVTVATTRDPESFAADVVAIAPRVIAKTLADAIFLAVRFEAHLDVAKALPSWQGKTIIDVTNAYGVPPRTWEADQAWRAVERRAAGPGARKELGVSDLQGPGEVRMMDTTPEKWRHSHEY